jgi:hypothetical protein
VESVNDQKNETEQIGEDEYVEETVHEQVQSVNEQENVCEQAGEAGVDETVLAHAHGLHGEESGNEAVTLSNQFMYMRRIRSVL